MWHLAGRSRQAVAAVLLTTYLSACTSWHVQQVAPAELIDHDHPDEIRVTTTTGNEMVLSHPFVDGDSLHEGKTKNGPPTGMALQDVHQVATRGFSAGKTIALGTGVVLVGLGTAAVIAVSNMGPFFTLSESARRHDR